MACNLQNHNGWGNGKNSGLDMIYSLSSLIKSISTMSDFCFYDKKKGVKKI